MLLWVAENFGAIYQNARWLRDMCEKKVKWKFKLNGVAYRKKLI